MLIIRSILLLIIISTVAVFANDSPKSPIPPSAEQNNQNPPKSSDEQSDKNNKSSEPIISTSKEIISKPQDQDSKHKGTQNHHWYDTFFNHTTDWFMVLFNLLLVLVTGFLVYYTSSLWKATIGLLEVSQEQDKNMKISLTIAQEATTAAKKSADAAEKSVYAAKETANVMRAQDRAYIFVNVGLDKFQKTPAEINRIMDEGLDGDYKAIIKIINHGKTPAVIKGFHYKIEFFTTKEVVDFFNNYWQTKSVIPSGGEIIESSKDQTYLFPFYVDPIEQQYFADSDSPELLCVGRIEYEDVFSNIHETVFCWGFSFLSADFIICEKYRYNYRT